MADRNECVRPASPRRGGLDRSQSGKRPERGCQAAPAWNLDPEPHDSWQYGGELERRTRYRQADQESGGFLRRGKAPPPTKSRRGSDRGVRTRAWSLSATSFCSRSLWLLRLFAFWVPFIKFVVVEERHRRCWGIRWGRVDVNRVQNMRRYEHQQFGIRLIDRLGAEQLSQDRDIAEAGHLAQLRGGAAVQQTRYAKRLALLEFDLGFSPPSRNPRHREAGDHQGVGEIQIADFREDVKAKRVVFLNEAGEVQLHAEGLEQNGDGVESRRGLNNREGEFATREKSSLLAADCHQIR